jgi:secreted trypsin-like serine protease
MWTGRVEAGHDIAILTLERDVDIPPVTVAGADTVLSVGQRLLVAGWGLNGPSPLLTRNLQVGSVRFVDTFDCNEMYRKAINMAFVTDTMICAFDETTDACSGDSGGPLVIPDPSDNPAGDILVGDVSLGVGGCVADGTPAIYGNIPHLFDFVRPHLRSTAPPVFSGVSPRPTLGCHEEHQVAWRIAVCPYGQNLWNTFLRPRFLDVLEDNAGLTPASVSVVTDWGFSGTKECSCTIYTRVTAVMSTFDLDEAKGLMDFVQLPGNILNPVKNLAFFMQCAETLDVAVRSVGSQCFS